MSDHSVRFVAVLLIALAVIGYLFYLTPARDELREQFGDERWSCAPLVASKPHVKRVGWVSSRFGLRIVVGSRSSLSFLKLGCRSVDERNTCELAHGGWQSVETVFQPSGRRVVFDHSTAGVDGALFLDAPLTGTLAEQLVSNFERNSNATVTVKGIRSSTVFAQPIDLAGFNDAMTACGF